MKETKNGHFGLIITELPKEIEAGILHITGAKNVGIRVPYPYHLEQLKEGKFAGECYFNVDINLKTRRGYVPDSPFTSGDHLATFHLVALNGCCGVCVSTNASVNETYRNLGIGTLLNSLRIYMAKEYGYGLLLCTDVESNIPQQKILENNGWSKVESFINPRTGNKVAIHTVEL